MMKMVCIRLLLNKHQIIAPLSKLNTQGHEIMSTTPHTVEKIGGTSMSRFDLIKDSIFIGQRKEHELYNRIFVVSAYAGVTNMLLEHKKTGKKGVYAHYCKEQSWEWGDALTDVLKHMCAINASLFDDEINRAIADNFISERIEAVRSCLIDLQRLCTMGPFKLHEHMSSVREMLSALGEAHSAHNLSLLLAKEGIKARFVDLSAWREEEQIPLDVKIKRAFADIDLNKELAICTGYTHCSEGLMDTYDRGYTEITFSRIAVMTKASEAIIHKEFHLSSADPNIIGEQYALPIGRTNYDVADQLSDMGMEAIHPGAAKGLRQAKIPLRIKHSFDADHPGTTITPDYHSETATPEIIAGQKTIIAISVHDQDMVGHTDSDLRLCRMIDRHNLRYLAKDTNANTITHYFNTSIGKIEALCENIEQELPNAAVSIDKMAVISIIGSNMAVPGILAKASNVLAEHDINILAIHQNMRQVDLRLFVPVNDYESAVCILHENLIQSKIPDEEHGFEIMDLATAVALA